MRLHDLGDTASVARDQPWARRTMKARVAEARARRHVAQREATQLRQICKHAAERVRGDRREHEPLERCEVLRSCKLCRVAFHGTVEDQHAQAAVRPRVETECSCEAGTRLDL